jgi:hypothetical protein
MKKLLLVGALVLIASGAYADPQRTGFTATTVGPKNRNALHPPPVTYRTQVEGVVPRAFRGGNPLQMLNPNAPARYGTWVDSTCFDPDIPGKWKGIKLFEILF